MKSLFVSSLCLMMVAFGCTQSASNPDEAAAVAVIEKLHGKVEFDGVDSDRRVIKVYLHSTAVRDEDLTVLGKLPRLRNLFLGKTNIGDAGLELLKDATELRTLSLNATAVTDVGLKSLAGLKQLKTLNVQETKVTATGSDALRAVIPGLTIAR